MAVVNFLLIAVKSEIFHNGNEIDKEIESFL